MIGISKIASNICKTANKNLQNIDSKTLITYSKLISGLVTATIGVSTNMAWALLTTGAKSSNLKSQFSKSGKDLYLLLNQK